MPRKIFGSRRGDVTKGWRNVHKEKLHQILSRDQMKEHVMGRACRTHG